MFLRRHPHARLFLVVYGVSVGACHADVYTVTPLSPSPPGSPPPVGDGGAGDLLARGAPRSTHKLSYAVTHFRVFICTTHCLQQFSAVQCDSLICLQFIH